MKENIKIGEIEPSSRIACEERMCENTLVDNLNYQCQLECDNPGVGIKEIGYAKAQLSEISQERYRGAVVRARAQKYILREQPTKHALAGEKTYALTKQKNSIECGALISSHVAVDVDNVS